MQIRVDKKQLKKNTLRTYKVLTNMFDKALKSFATDTENRSKKVHDYKNRTGYLTKSTDSKTFEKKDNMSASIFNSAKYAGYVESNTGNKWIQNAMRYYKRDFERDVNKVPSELR